jgi:catechol 2,3-dioxygenase-like lactoylglutathione lyase family enzyme
MSFKINHIQHIGIPVTNLKVSEAFYNKLGFVIIEDAPVFLPFWEKGCKYFNISGPDGERIEFNQILL